MNFLDRFSKSIQKLNFIKIRPVEADLFHAEGRTDLMKQIVAFHCFAKAPKHEKIQLYSKYLFQPSMPSQQSNSEWNYVYIYINMCVCVCNVKRWVVSAFVRFVT